MSGAFAPDPEREAIAAEYVLGTLDAHEAAAVVRAMATDAALADAVAAWERRFAPLMDLIAPQAPPLDLWSRIERRIAPQVGAVAAARERAGASWRMRLLGGWAFGASVVAAALGTFILLSRQTGPQPASVMTVLLTDRTQAAWTAAFDPDGALRLAAIPPVGAAAQPPTPEDRVQQLWVLPPGATAPTSLGLLPRDQARVTVQAPTVQPVPGMLIEITLEPPGGSSTGRPTGPILFIGRLSAPGPDS